MSRRLFSSPALPCAAVLALATLSSCRLLSASVPCERDENCPPSHACEEARCVAPLVDAGVAPKGEGEGEGEGAPDAGSSRDAGFPDGGRVRYALTIPAGSVEEPLSDFPVLVRLTAPDVDLTAFQPDGSDVRFEQDGVALPHEIELWDPDGTSAVWVRLPLVDDDADTVFHLYGADPTPPPAPAPSEVWSNAFDAVFHLDDGNDSARGLTTTPVGTPAPDDGQVAGATRFGDGTALDLGAAPDLVAGHGAFTISLWLHLDALLNDQGWALFNVALHNDGVVNGRSRVALELNAVDARPKLIVRAPDDDETGGVFFGATGVPFTEWAHLAVRVDVANDGVALLLNGEPQVLDATYDFPGAALDDTAPANGAIGAGDDVISLFADGALDELRISSAARSDAWLRAELASMQPGFVVVGPAEPAP